MIKNKAVEDICLFTLNANRPLAEAIAGQLGLTLSRCSITNFADGEISITIDESVRGREVYVLQSISEPVNTNLMELLIMIDALRRASAKKINIIMPYYGYARQNCKVRPREPITAKLIADLLAMDGISRLITIDLHVPQIQGFFDLPVDHLLAAPTLAKHFLDLGIKENLVIVAPDHAGVNLVRHFAELMGGVPIAIVDRRIKASRNSSYEVPTTIIGDVVGKTTIIVDDIIDTGSRMTTSAELLKQCGASRIYGAVTHAILSGDACERLMISPIEKMVFTDTICLPSHRENSLLGRERRAKLVRLSVAPLLAEAIDRIHNHRSIHDLYQLPEHG